MKAKDIMTSNPACCIAESSAFDAALLMEKLDFGCLPVVSGQTTRRLVGMVTDRDLCLAVVARGALPTSITVNQAMTSPPITCGPESSVEDCVGLMRKHRVHRIPVVDRNGACVGLVSHSDMAKACVPEMVKETEASFPNAVSPEYQTPWAAFWRLFHYQVDLTHEKSPAIEKEELERV